MHTRELTAIEIAAAARRAELSSNWPTAAEVGRAMGSSDANPADLATRLRHTGQLLEVYLVEPFHHYRFPTWQFQGNGQPVPYFADILATLREYGSYLDEEGRTTGWGEVQWFLSHHMLLDSRPPYEVLVKNPRSVLEAARAEYIDEDDSGGF